MKATDMTHYRWIKWLLFSIFLFTVPMPLYLVAAFGMVPVAASVFLTIGEITNIIRGIGAGGIVFTIIIGGQALIFGGIIYLVALVVARILCGALSKEYAALLTTLLIGGLVVASCFNVYRLAQHHSMPSTNLAGVARYVGQWSGSPVESFFHRRILGIVPRDPSKQPTNVIFIKRGATPGLIKVHPSNIGEKQE